MSPGARWLVALLTGGTLTVVTNASGRGCEEVPKGFVCAEGTRLKLNGGDYYFSGANSFTLLYSEADAAEQIRIAAQLGLNALRLWGFWDGEVLEPVKDAAGNVLAPPTPDTDEYGHYVLQSRPGVYPEPAWRRLDYAIYLAQVHGIRLIIPLMNQWPEFGGIDQYLRWTGSAATKGPAGHYEREAAAKKDRYRFWHSEAAQGIYFDYVEHLLNRVNVYTGVAYKDDPTIMIWEIMNEGRYGYWEGDPEGLTMRDFYAEAARFIKAIDPNHLVGTGEEGFLRRGAGRLGREAYPFTAAAGEGTDFELNGAIPDIDVLGIHCWPFQWSLWRAGDGDPGYDRLGEYPDIAAFPPEWIAAHARIARDLGKPLYLGEFGLQILRVPGSDLPERNAIMRAAYDAVRHGDLAGAAFWHLTASHDPQSVVYQGEVARRTLLQGQSRDGIRPHDLDFRFDVFCPEDVSTCGIIEGFTAAMTARVEHPDPPDDARFHPPCLPPWEVCGDECVITASHPDHCGGCGVACSPSTACVRGGCLPLTALPD